jgi:hypothetical protein
MKLPAIVMRRSLSQERRLSSITGHRALAFNSAVNSPKERVFSCSLLGKSSLDFFP